ncbi:MAG TPA: 6-bladed beta-propeller, partial [Nitrosopumilaceae archaeon]|nr:6-bladed beta-propeller [Nitrosopumilaceae archaeon]
MSSSSYAQEISGGSITGSVYNDTNGDLIKDGGEKNLSSWNVVLSKNGVVVSSTNTDVNGQFSFLGLAAGFYNVSASLASPYVATQPLNDTYQISINSNDTVSKIFGVSKNDASLTNFGDIIKLAPETVVMDSHGFLYDTDVTNGIVKKFDRNGTLIKTIGSQGFGQGQFFFPSGVAFDSHENIWVSDSASGRIQKFDPNGNYLMSFGSNGNSSSQLNRPRGIAIDSQDNIYVADGNNNRVQKFDKNGNYLLTIGKPGSPFSYLRLPFDVTLDSQGNVLVINTGNNRVEKYDSNGKYLVTFGKFSNGSTPFNRPRSIHVGPDDYSYVADTYNNRIVIFDKNYNFVRSFGSLGSLPGKLANPSGVFINSTGTIFVTDSSNDRMQIFNNDGTFVSDFRIRPSKIEPYFVNFDPSGNLLVSDGHNHQILLFDPNTGYLLSHFAGLGADAGTFHGPRGMATDKQGNLYVADNYNNRVEKFDANSNFVLQFGTSGSGPGQFNQPRGVLVDSTGNILVADTQNNRIQKFDNSGNYIASFPTVLPYQIAFDAQGNVYSADENANYVEKIAPNGTSLARFGTSGSGSGQLSNPRGVFVDGTGIIYISDSANNRIQKFDSNGNFISSIGKGGTGFSQFSDPRGIVVDSSGNIWVDDTGNFRVQELTNNGTFIKQINYTFTGNDVTSPSVTATPAGGFYQSSQLVNLTASEPSTIYYTLDGTSPTTTSSIFTGPIAIGSNTKLKFFARDVGGNNSPTSTQVYSFPSSINIGTISNSSPRWDIDSVLVSGTITNSAVADTVTIDWGDGKSTSNIAIVGGTWGPVSHTYDSSSLMTNPNQIVATLVNSTNSKASSSPSSITVQKHKTALALVNVSNLPWGQSTLFGMTLNDTDSGSTSSGKVIHFNGTGVIGVSDQTTNSSGKSTGIGTAPNTVSNGWTYQSHFAGDSFYQSSDSAILSYNTTKHNTSLSLLIQPNPVTHGATYKVGGVLKDTVTGTTLSSKT